MAADTHAASLQQQLAFAETVGAVGELHQSFLCLVSDGGVGRLIQLLTQDLQLGKALDKHREEEDTRLISNQQSHTHSNKNFINKTHQSKTGSKKTPQHPANRQKN